MWWVQCRYIQYVTCDCYCYCCCFMLPSPDPHPCRRNSGDQHCHGVPTLPVASRCDQALAISYLCAQATHPRGLRQCQGPREATYHTNSRHIHTRSHVSTASQDKSTVGTRDCQAGTLYARGDEPWLNSWQLWQPFVGLLRGLVLPPPPNI